MKNLFLLVLLLFSFAADMSAQRNCATMEVLDQELKNDPSLKQRMDEIEIQTNDFVAQNLKAKGSRVVVTIPVVFHVLYRTTTENVSDAQLLSQLTVLNQDFRFSNADKSLIPAEFAPLGSDVEVEFCLATQSPTGAATTGIERKSTSKLSWGTSSYVKLSNKGGLNAWDRTKYLNIWVCNIGGSTLGYATLPGGTAALDGVVIDFKYIGTIGTATAPFNKGRTATHEVGHWLNLRHIWGDATCGSDNVSDTPAHNTYNFGCPVYPHLSTCTGTPTEMTMNYMDYVDDQCMQMFTAGQKLRMRAVLEGAGARASIASSPGCLPPSTTTCGAPASIAASSVTSSSAVVTWAAVTGASSYSLEYKLGTATSWTVLPVTTTSYTFSNLAASTTYNVRVRAVCSGTNGTYSTVLNITTTAASTCGVPTGLVATNILANSATCSWTAISGASAYSFQYKTSSATSWITLSPTATSVNLTGLIASTTYNMQVAAVCSGITSAYSALSNFTTTPIGTTCADNYDTNSTNNNTKTKSSAITPGTAITAKIGTTTDVDWYKFSNTSAARNVKVTLSNLPADYDMTLYRSSTTIGTSENDGTLNEVMIHNNSSTPTTYYVRVYPFGGAFNNAQCYTLLAQISSSSLSRLNGEQTAVESEEETIVADQLIDEFVAFPNPVTAELTMLLPFGKHQTGKISLADMTGKQVYTEEYSGSNEIKTVMLDVSSLKPGFYLLQYLTGNQVKTQKIVVAQRQ